MRTIAAVCALGVLEAGCGSSNHTSSPTTNAPTAPKSGSSAENPIPLGMTGRVGQWTVRVISLMKAPRDNSPPPAGYAFMAYMVQFNQTKPGQQPPIFNQTEPGQHPSFLPATLLGPSKAQRTAESNPMCGFATPPTTSNEVHIGQGTESGCISVLTSDSDDLVMGVGSEPDIVWFATK